MFSLLWTALIGLVVGALAKLIMPGKDPAGILITMVIVIYLLEEGWLPAGMETFRIHTFY